MISLVIVVGSLLDRLGERTGGAVCIPLRCGARTSLVVKVTRVDEEPRSAVEDDVDLRIVLEGRCGKNSLLILLLLLLLPLLVWCRMAFRLDRIGGRGGGEGLNSSSKPVTRGGEIYIYMDVVIL